jgi:hypothetical protein
MALPMVHSVGAPAGASKLATVDTMPPITIPPVTIPPITIPPITIPPALKRLLETTTTTPRPKPKPQASPAPLAATGPVRYPSGSSGYDISWPECGGPYPVRPFTVAIVGANDGRAFTANPCLTSEARWAGPDLQLYLNINSPTSSAGPAADGPAGRCAPQNDACLAYNFGYNDATETVAAAVSKQVRARTWWIDVETVGPCVSQFPTAGDGYWSCNHSLNAWTIQGAIDGLLAAHEVVGVYSTGYQWGVITGGYRPRAPSLATWVPGADPTNPNAYCGSSLSFAGGTTWLVQLWADYAFDHDLAC